MKIIKIESTKKQILISKNKRIIFHVPDGTMFIHDLDRRKYMWETIERLLKERGMTKNKLATLAGINKNSLIDLKMGRKKSLKFEDVVKIADTLGVSLDEFR